MPSKPTRLADPLHRLLQRIDPDKRLEVYRLWTFWDREVGEAIAARARPASYRAGVLAVRVSSAAWMQELQFMKEEIRERLNARLGEELVRDIYFVSGPTAEAPAPAPPRDTVREGAAESEPVTLPRLRDPRLAEVFERILRAHRRRSRRDPT
jgi:predicted nucleic acid-binding Zn ribbon protein